MGCVIWGRGGGGGVGADRMCVCVCVGGEFNRIIIGQTFLKFWIRAW